MAEAPPPNQPPKKPDDKKKKTGKSSTQASHSEGEQSGGRKRLRGEGGYKSDTTVYYFRLQDGKPVLQAGPASSDSSDSASSRTSVFRITLPPNFSHRPPAAAEPSWYRSRSLSGSAFRRGLEGAEFPPLGQPSAGSSSSTSEEELAQRRGSSDRSLSPLSDLEASIRRFIDFTYRDPLPQDQRDFVCVHTDPTLPWRGDDTGNRSSSSGSSDVSHGIPTRFRSMHGTFLSSADSVESYLGDAASTSSGSVSAVVPVPLSLRKPPPDLPGYGDSTSQTSSAMCLSDLPVEMPDLESSSGREDDPYTARSGRRYVDPLSAVERADRWRSIYSERAAEELEAVGRVREAPVPRGLPRSRSATFPFVRWHTLSDTALQVVGPGDGWHGYPLHRNLRPRLELSSSGEDSAFGLSSVSI